MNRQLTLIALALGPALIGGCQTTPAAEERAGKKDQQQAGLGTIPSGIIELTDAEVAEVTRGVFTAVVPLYYFRDEETFPVKATGTTGKLPPQVGGVKIVPWDEDSFRRAVDLRFLEREYDDLVVQVYIRNPIGGPSIYDVMFTKTGDGWTFRRILDAVEYL